MNAFTAVFLLFLAGSTAGLWYLATRQLAALRHHRHQVPTAFRNTVTLEDHQRAADYNSAQVRLERLDLLLGAGLLLLWTLGGGLNIIDNAWRALAWGPVATGVGVILSAFLIMGLLDLPVDLYRTFIIEQRFGFNRVTPRLYAVDTLKKAALSVAIGTPVAAVILVLMDSAGATWWWWGWGVWMSFVALMLWAYPEFIAPLFNDFKPLDDEQLRTRITGLLERSGFKSGGIFVMDGSRRSSHGNAYFTGFGAKKRIVFFDTLLASLSHKEITAVLAHELGHFKHRHVQKRLAWMALGSLAGFALLGWACGADWFFRGLGVERPSAHMALLLFLLISPSFTAVLRPLSSHWQRQHEFEADEYAARCSNPEDLIRALVKLYEENAATLTPDPCYSAYHDSHPPAPLRIRRLQSMAV
ncbi:MAG TPA: M48 family peptidase [Gammaproteobacteria bacterium]|nr:M48 family peptidase [Gammaproteobacteria bacterium]